MKHFMNYSSQIVCKKKKLDPFGSVLLQPTFCSLPPTVVLSSVRMRTNSVTHMNKKLLNMSQFTPSISVSLLLAIIEGLITRQGYIGL